MTPFWPQLINDSGPQLLMKMKDTNKSTAPFSLKTGKFSYSKYAINSRHIQFLFSNLSRVQNYSFSESEIQTGNLFRNI